MGDHADSREHERGRERKSSREHEGGRDPRNVDQAELEKFQSIASRWWDPSSEFAPLHAINPLRVEWVREHLPARSFKDLKVLDAGCGGGILSEAMARAGARVTGIDLAQKSLSVARLHALDAEVPVDYECVAVEELAAREPGSYDVITCMEMLEHVPDPQSIVESCARLVKPGGRVFFSTLHRNPKSFLFAILGAEYLLRLLPRGTHQYERLIRPSELIAGCRAEGLEPIAMTGLTYNPLTRHYALDPKDVSVNYMVALEMSQQSR